MADRKDNQRAPCPCPCGCVVKGCTRHVSARLCWACTEGTHHKRGFGQ